MSVVMSCDYCHRTCAIVLGVYPLDNIATKRAHTHKHIHADEKNATSMLVCCEYTNVLPFLLVCTYRQVSVHIGGAADSCFVLVIRDGCRLVTLDRNVSDNMDKNNEKPTAHCVSLRRSFACNAQTIDVCHKDAMRREKVKE